MNMYLDKFRIEEMFRKVMERFDLLDEKLTVKEQTVHPLDGEKLLDTQDMCLLFKISKRTLAGYRQKKLIPYYAIDGKTYYKASEVLELLKKKGKL